MLSQVECAAGASFPSEPTVCLALGSLDTHMLRSAGATHFTFFSSMATTHSDSFGDYSESIISRAARHVS